MSPAQDQAVDSLARMLNGPHDADNRHAATELAQLRDIRWRNATDQERHAARSLAKAILAKFDLAPRAGSSEPAYIGIFP